MSELGDVLGDDFEEKYESKTQQRREEANKVDKETVKKICYKAVEGDGFDGEEPRFTYEGGEVPHDVLLMESPDQDLQKFRHNFDNGGVSLGMFHLGELFSCAFNEDMLDVVDQIEQDTYYIVIGRYQEKRDTDGSGNERVYYNINPVRGIVPLPQAKKFSEEYSKKMSGSSVEEQAQEQTQEESGSSSSDDGGDEDTLDEDILKVLRHVAKEKESVIKAVADGDSDSLESLVGVVNNNISQSATEEDVVRVFEAEIEEIDDEEEEEEDDFGLDGLGDEDDSDESETSDPEPETEETDDSDEEETADDDEDDEESPDDWF